MTIEIEFNENVIEQVFDFKGVKVRVRKNGENEYQIWIDDDKNRFIQSKLPDGYHYLGSSNNITLDDTCHNEWWSTKLSDANGSGYFKNGYTMNLEQIKVCIDAVVNGVDKLEELNNNTEIHNISKIKVTLNPVPFKQNYVMMKIEGLKHAWGLNKSKLYLANPPIISYRGDISQDLYISDSPISDRYEPVGVKINGCKSNGSRNVIDLDKEMTKDAAMEIIGWIKKCVDNYNVLVNTEVIKVGNVTITKVPIPNDHDVGRTDMVPFSNYVRLTIEGLISALEYPDEISHNGNIAWTVGNTFKLYDENNNIVNINNIERFPLTDFICLNKNAERVIEIIKKSEEKLEKYKKEQAIIKVGDIVRLKNTSDKRKVIGMDGTEAWVKRLSDNYYSSWKIKFLIKINDD